MVQQERSRRLVTGLVVTMTGLAVVGTSASAQPAGASTCTGATTTWTGMGDGTTWTQDANWSPASPTASDAVMIDTSASSTPVSIVGVANAVCDLTVNGAGAVATTFTGELQVDGTGSLSGALGWNGRLHSTQSLALAASTDLAVGDGSVVLVDGVATLGASTVVHGPSGPSSVPVLRVGGTLALAGSAHLSATALELVQGPSTAGSVDLAGATLTVDGAATSRFDTSSTLTSTQPSGVLALGTGAALVATTGMSVQSGAVLRIAGATFGGGGQSATLTGTGTLDWRSGAVEGDVTLALPTALDGGGTRVVPPASTLTTTNQLSVADGILQLDGTLVNSGTVLLSPGSSVQGSSTSVLSNLAGATLAVAPTNVGAAVLDGVHLTNAGTISVPLNARLVLGSSSTPTVSDLLAGSTLSAPSLPGSAGSDTAGTLQVSQGSTVRLTGQVVVDKALLLLDDPTGAGDTARLEVVGAQARLAAPTGGAGSFSWRNGTVAGALTIDGLTSDISSDRDTGTQRVLESADDAHPGVLRLGGTSSLVQTTLELAPKASVVVAGTLTLACTSGGVDAMGSLDGQQLVVATGGLLRSVAQGTTPTGSCNSPTGMTLLVPVMNSGTVSLETPLHVLAGYTQDVAAGAPAGAGPPVTGLFGGAVLSSANGTDAGPITLVKGGLGGTGTVEANPLTTGTGFLHPGTSTTSGTMTLKGPVHLGAGTELQIVLRSATDHDKLVVQPLTVGANTYPGSLTLAGRLTGISTGYDPPYGVTVPAVVSADLRTGTFGSADSSGNSGGRGWRPTYPTDNKTVGLTIVDVAPPSLGIADNPAFTLLSTQRFTYYAVDNRSGVKNYDVRYRYGSSSGGWSALQYPAAWRGTTATSVTRGLTTGYTYCFSVRARDNALNTTPWSQELCTARLYDDRAATPSAGWSRPSGQTGAYYGTVSSTTRAGATLKRSGNFRRLALAARRCPTCGAVAVYSGGTLIAKVNLASRSTGTTFWVSPLLASRTTVATFKVISAGRTVAIDAIGLAR